MPSNEFEEKEGFFTTGTIIIMTFGFLLLVLFGKFIL